MQTHRLQALLLGAPRFVWQGTTLDLPSRRGLALLGVVALRRTGVPRGELAELLWGPDRLQNLRQELYRLRRLPGAGTWLDAGEIVRIDAETDVERFDALAARGAAGEALELWRGPLLTGVDDLLPALERLIDEERTRLDRVRSSAWTTRHRAWLAVSDLTTAERATADALAIDPSDGLAHEAGIELALLAGDAVAARERLEAARRAGAELAVGRWEGVVGDLGARALAHDLLPAPVKRALQALTLEPSLSPALLAGVLDVPSLLVAEHLEAARSLGWLDADGRVPPEQAARLLEGTPEPVRLVLHVRIAEVLPDDDPRAPEHLARAGEPDAAARLLVRIARERADEAAARRASELAVDPSVLADALSTLAEACRPRGEGRPPTDALDALASRTQLPGVVFAAALQRGAQSLVERDIDRAWAAVTEARELVEDHDLHDGAPQVAFLDGAIRLGVGDPAGAHGAFLRATRSADTSVRVRALNALGAAAAQQGDLDAADRAHREALALARNAGLRPLALRLLNSLGANAHRRGDLDAAVRRFREAVEVSGEVRDHALARTARANLATLLQESGRIGESRAVVGALIDDGRAAGDGRALAGAWRMRARLEQFAGRWEEAASWSTRSAEQYALAGDAPNAATSRFNAAVQSWQADPRRARWPDVAEALGSLRGQSRLDLTLDASFEAAWIAPDPEALDAARAGLELPLARRIVLDQRRALLVEPGAPALAGLNACVAGPGLIAVLARGLRACTAGADRAGDLDAVRADVLRAGEGLLGSQLETLIAVLNAWCADPVRVPWF